MRMMTLWMVVGCEPAWDGVYAITDAGGDVCGLGLAEGEPIVASRAGSESGTLYVGLGPEDLDCVLDDGDRFTCEPTDAFAKRAGQWEQPPDSVMSVSGSFGERTLTLDVEVAPESCGVTIEAEWAAE